MWGRSRVGFGLPSQTRTGAEGKRNRTFTKWFSLVARGLSYPTLFLARPARGDFHREYFSRMKVLVADKISPKGVAYLRQQPGFDVVEAYGSSPEKVLELVKDVHAIAVRSETKITAEVFKAEIGRAHV